ncbi:MAG: bifunctional (p)ppGpp synthetase/guanosine-3',5'-bis(diphosphate) 3'-pyrophosphohydrolase [Gammaproteobacteria bacterium]|nr:bifunctional (p)ppGpp synthetase/guanosine-3',5'-bis(diphosphate) 3'-pyrophosphohydrolase [Gammaproteobacteria bacterium]NNF62236.1 bifunctional (p)ppGpp synthetase/guanosine-3',5'-bis(diphosphate) 3'-pyrophosphohydrolase [Gammaproteobacteria bacterium]NNM21033.1 bifunctional (p)ppGpp synthetase/guanosine-3',5'-bis(diphosphate) 3'-pyrophosphohydrolase [Gammaproteobacteria bacterium]
MSTAASILSRLPRGKQFADIKELLARLQEYLPEEQINTVYDAYSFGAEAHEGQKRLSGEPYITHPVAVAGILAELRMDYQSLCAALLHDVIEDTGTDKQVIAERFGDDVAEIVDAVSKLDQLRFKSKAEAQAESFRKMLLAVAKDIRVILVKLADRLHNMRTLDVLPQEKRGRIARETLEIYAPIANRLGIHSIRVELEDLSFRNLYPNRYEVLERHIKKNAGSRRVLKRIIDTVDAALDDAGISGRVSGREKHVYSIYQKMQRKGRSLAEIGDVYGFRIIVDDVDTCYRSLGVVHRLYKPMPGRFKDYIAIPRMNGYQSLHTTLFGPKGVPIEVQIRTEDMDKLAESGIAAHWFYKTGEKPSSSAHARAREWLDRMVEMQESGSSEEFLESVRIDLFPEKVYVFTPNGDIRRLPRGATVIDFAYAVHTDVGNRCVGAKIDRRPVPLHTTLRNGQTVEIIKSRTARPNPAWVNFVVTAKARSAIRSYLKSLRHSEAVRLGKRLLSKSLADLSLTIRKVSRNKLKATLDELKLESTDALYAEIGLGRQLAPLIARRLMPDSIADESQDSKAAPVAIAGAEGMLVTYARCCYPVPPDNIMGYLSAGRGLVVHRETCGNLVDYRKQPDKWIAVEWEPDLDREFPVEIRVDVINRMGVLAAVSANIAGNRSNIENVQVVERDGDNSTLTFMLQVTDGEHLGQVLAGIKGMPEVLRVQRICA